MNIQRLPFRDGSYLPSASQARGVDQPYRGGGAPEFEPRGMDVRALILMVLGLVIKYRLLIAACCAGALLGGFIVTHLMPRVYSATTTIKIDRSSPTLLKGQRDESSWDPQFLQTEFELIKSRSMAERVAANLNLGQTDFVPYAQPSLWGRLTGARGNPAELDAAAIQQRQRQAVGQIMGGLALRQAPMSSIVRISYSGPNPAWAQRISIAVAEHYERSTVDRRFRSSEQTRAFLDERLREIKIKLQESEKQLIDYAQIHGIVSVDEKQPAAAAALAAVQEAVAKATLDRVAKEQVWLLAQSGNVMALPQIMGDKLIQAARDRIGTLQATYQEKLTVLRPAFPEMVALRAQIQEAEKQVRTQVELIREATRREYEAARAQEAALLARLDDVKAELLDLRGRSVDYMMLLREVDTARSLYEGLLQQLRELSVTGEMQASNVSIIDRALLPGGPSSPSLRKNLLISLALGLFAAAGVIGLREVLDDTFKSPEEIEEGTGLATLGLVPRGERKDGDLIAEIASDMTSPLAEAYRSLRTALQFSTEDGIPRSILVTSSKPGEGKSTTSAALALNFAQLNMRVLLIDADMRNPSLHAVLGSENGAGLSNYLAGGQDPSELAGPCSLEGVTLMTTGPLPPNPAELLAGPRFATLLSLAAERFDVVIVDGPPVMGLADAPIIASMAAGTLLVIECSETRRAVVRDALKRLNFARARMVGAVLNKFDWRDAGYSYDSNHTGYSYFYRSSGAAEPPRLPGAG
jgi:capsular exopolysaccharide synthesis family protein